MKTSFLQSQLAYNAATITALIYERKDTISDAKLALGIGDGALAHMDFKAALRLRMKIKNMATIQRAIKEEIKAARTTKRVYKKHPPVRAQARGGMIDADWLASAENAKLEGFASQKNVDKFLSDMVGTLPVPSQTAT